VLNVNYTHIFSDATFNKTRMTNARVPQPVDTSYTDKLYQQPTDVVNLSVGYDYKKFSILASMIYQSQVFNQPNFWWMLRSDKATYLRWDIVIKQGLPWLNMEIYCDANNLNNATDLSIIRKNDLPISENSYGLTEILEFDELLIDNDVNHLKLSKFQTERRITKTTCM